jgi:hypothetical protein
MEQHPKFKRGGTYEHDWINIFVAKGYMHVDYVPSHVPWHQVHERCERYFGAANYVWFGHSFWFTTAEQAVIFSLIS